MADKTTSLSATDSLNVMEVVSFLKNKTPEEASLAMLQFGQNWDKDLASFAYSELDKVPKFKASGRFRVPENDIPNQNTSKAIITAGAKLSLMPEQKYKIAKSKFTESVGLYNETVLKREVLLEHREETLKNFNEKSLYLNALIEEEYQKPDYWNNTLTLGAAKGQAFGNIRKTNLPLVEELDFLKSELTKISYHLGESGTPKSSDIERKKAKLGRAEYSDSAIRDKILENYIPPEESNLMYKKIAMARAHVFKAVKNLNIYEGETSKTSIPPGVFTNIVDNWGPDETFVNVRGLESLSLIDLGEE